MGHCRGGQLPQAPHLLTLRLPRVLQPVLLSHTRRRLPLLEAMKADDVAAACGIIETYEKPFFDMADRFPEGWQAPWRAKGRESQYSVPHSFLMDAGIFQDVFRAFI